MNAANQTSENGAKLLCDSGVHLGSSGERHEVMMWERTKLFGNRLNQKTAAAFQLPMTLAPFNA